MNPWLPHFVDNKYRDPKKSMAVLLRKKALEFKKRSSWNLQDRELQTRTS